MPNNIVDPERKTLSPDSGSTQSLLDPAQDESVLREWKLLKEAFPCQMLRLLTILSLELPVMACLFVT